MGIEFRGCDFVFVGDAAVAVGCFKFRFGVTVMKLGSVPKLLLFLFLFIYFFGEIEK